MTFRSPFVHHALALREQVRQRYQEFLYAVYEQAERDCRGNLVNRRGLARGIDGWSLFMGNRNWGRAYASEELLEWWETHPRIPFEEFEQNAFEVWKESGLV